MVDQNQVFVQVRRRGGAPSYFGVLAMMVLGLILAGCATSEPPATMTDSYHWRPADRPVGWIVFLPGSSGLRILDDDQHYFNVARRFNEQGWSVLVVDYKPAYHAGQGPKGSTAEKIAWVTEQAVQWLLGEHAEVRSQPGALMGWSLGSQGVLKLIGDSTQVARLGIRCAVVYYPFQPLEAPLTNQVPLLVLSGAADTVSPVRDVSALGENRPTRAGFVEIQIYPGAHHGFDVASLSERTTVRLLPLVGPSMTLQYDAEAAQDAELRIRRFLVEYTKPLAF